MNRDVTPLPESACAPGTDSESGLGTLETGRGRLPLIGLDVNARITGLMAQLQLRQTFRNPLDETLEATYIFPLPDRAAVTRFQMRVAGRTIDGELKERGQAREEYDEAISRGHRAAIAEEDRSGVFQLRVGNLPPREEAVVELTLVAPLPVADGEATFRFPLVVAPRYTPGIPLDGPSVGGGVTPDTDQVPDASRVTPPVLLPGFPNPVALSFDVELDPAGIAADETDWPRQIRSSLHSVITDEGPPWIVRLQPGERLNRDFILRYPVARSAVAPSLVCSPATDGRPGTFALTLLPPTLDTTGKQAPRRIVFVVDRSGSMGGWKMVAARRALGRMIDTLLDQDQFTVLAFDNVVEPLPAAENGLIFGTDRNRWQAIQWLGNVGARGGTEMGPALECAIQRCGKPSSGSDPILILVTDGQTTGEDAILRSLSRGKGKKNLLPRIFSVGIDRAVNASFLRRLSDLARGECELVESEDRLDDAMDRIHRLMGRPLLTQVRLEPDGCQWVDGSLAPQRLPDLHADRPVTVFGRHHSNNDVVCLRIHAIGADGQPWQHEVTGQVADAKLLTSLWGRAKVRDLEDEYAAGTADPERLMQRIVNVSLESHVLSRFTAYVAVDRSETIGAEGRPVEIIQPVELADGWAHDSASYDAVAGQFRCLSLSAPRAACFFESIAGESGDYLLQAFPSSRAERSAQSSRFIKEPATPTADDRRQIRDRYLACLETQNSDDARNFVVAVLTAGIQAGASQIIADRVRWRIRIRFQQDGELVEHVRLPAKYWSGLRDALCSLAGINPSASAWPQQGQVQVQGVALTVTIDEVKGRETVLITIPPQQTASPRSSTARRKRFWT